MRLNLSKKDSGQNFSIPKFYLTTAVFVSLLSALYPMAARASDTDGFHILLLRHSQERQLELHS
ncbi:hypothetical protein LEP1GSC060_0770 [Leptospira weilii serovar Ranarum str. ICFT]|uniref:Uncharacterized protein n=1 Tax=Leptospira weilii serovar Ranarum str. ICFT TaxID=1218598 RepID=N1WR72_9LEPT|nr:hypothetical protein LEP1GSC060_0770 [Leptospira weilii serovar Ranarum str. ICFT]